MLPERNVCDRTLMALAEARCELACVVGSTRQRALSYHESGNGSVTIQHYD
jgi:hypothetical protein